MKEDVFYHKGKLYNLLLEKAENKTTTDSEASILYHLMLDKEVQGLIKISKILKEPKNNESHTKKS